MLVVKSVCVCEFGKRVQANKNNEVRNDESAV